MNNTNIMDVRNAALTYTNNSFNTDYDAFIAGATWMKTKLMNSEKLIEKDIKPSNV